MRTLLLILFLTILSCPSVCAQGISGDEREALVALYKATDGDHWTHRDGWLGAAGTECRWYGVACNNGAYGNRNNVHNLDLAENNLVGAIPEELGSLSHLEGLNILANHLSGMVPRVLTERAVQGGLDISAEDRLLTDITKIEYRWNPTSLLCGRRIIELEADGRARSFTKTCRKKTRRDRTNFCVVKEGKVWVGDFAQLAWLIERNGFFSLQQKHWRGVTDVVGQNTRVTRAGKVYEIENYATDGPARLWEIQRAIDGIAASIEWERTSKQAVCPELNTADGTPK